MNADLEQWTVTKTAVSGQGGMVAAQNVVAARAGAAMLEAGGNAVDAAVAAAFALGVVEPWMCGLGGSGYAVIWIGGKPAQLDFQGTLPAAISGADYPLDPAVPMSIMGFPGVVDCANVRGARAVTVPGALAGLAAASARFGRLGLERVMAPAIALAEAGLGVDWFTTLQVALAAGDLARDPGAAAAWLPGGHPPLPETRLGLDALAATLRQIAAEGPDAFYRGPIGARLVADLRAGGSRITTEDLASYRVAEPPPLVAHHRGVRLHTAGQTSGGRRLCDFLAEIAKNPATGALPGPETWVRYARALDAAWAGHKARIGRATEVGGCTSHLSTVDGEGGMVALTFTLLNRFGAGVVSPQTGILLNNAVSYFDPRPGYPTSMAGGKRINASNMCPIVAEREGEALFAIGASGANHIMPATAQIAAFMLDCGMDLDAALNHPRIDASDRGSVHADPRLGAETLDALRQHWPVELAQRLVFPKLYACPSGVSRDPATGRCQGLNDPSQPLGGAAAPAPFQLPDRIAAEPSRRP